MENNVKLPIFIGTTKSPEILKKIDEFLVENYPGTELVVITPEIQNKLEYMYMLKNLDRDQVVAIEQERNNKERNMQAEISAKQLNNILKEYIETDESGFVVETYTQDQLRKAVLKSGRKLSNKQTDEIVDFLSIHEFLNPVEVPNNKRHLTKWKLTFNPQQKVLATEELQKSLRDEIEQNQIRIDLLEENKNKYLSELSPVEEKPKKSRTKKDKPSNLKKKKADITKTHSVSAEQLLEHDSDCSCSSCNSTEETETEAELRNIEQEK